MPVTNPWKSYRLIAAQTAPPGQLVLMLFDAALLSLNRALLGFDMNEVGERNVAIHNNLQHAVDILRELNWSLDLEAGGQLAQTLRSLYTFFERRIVESNVKKSRKGVDEVLPMITSLRDAWFQMLNTGNPGPALADWTTNRLVNS
jgi:flagellar protein FliS